MCTYVNKYKLSINYVNEKSRNFLIEKQTRIRGNSEVEEWRFGKCFLILKKLKEVEQTKISDYF